MSPITSLQFLPEPAYVLLGGLLPPDGSDTSRVLVSPESILAFPAESRALLEFFTVLRSRTDAAVGIAAWDGEADDLDRLVDDGMLVRFPADDEAGTREVLGDLTIRIAADAATAPDGRSVLLRLPNHRAVDIDPITAAVLDAPVIRSLSASVAAVAESGDVDEDTIWRSVVHDLTGILTTGAGNVALPGAVA